MDFKSLPGSSPEQLAAHQAVHSTAASDTGSQGPNNGLLQAGSGQSDKQRQAAAMAGGQQRLAALAGQLWQPRSPQQHRPPSGYGLGQHRQGQDSDTVCDSFFPIMIMIMICSRKKQNDPGPGSRYPSIK